MQNYPQKDLTVSDCNNYGRAVVEEIAIYVIKVVYHSTKILCEAALNVNALFKYYQRHLSVLGNTLHYFD